MKFLGILLLIFAATLAPAATLMTVEQLKTELASMKQAGKSDEDVATRLKEINLSEELSHSAKASLAPYLPGDFSNEQILIMQARSAFLPPPAGDIVSAPAPDGAAQKAILDKTTDYVTKTYGQLPAMTATKSTARYQDSISNGSSAPGLVVNGPNTYARLADEQVDRVETEHGVEKPAEKDKTPWGQNGEVSPPGPQLPLAEVVQEALAGGKLAFEHWQTVGDTRIAVFTFGVDKKKSRYDVSYCCFPKTDTASGVAAMGTFVPVPGEIQSVSSWRPYKKTVPFHGELYINPDSGAVVRVIEIAELKPNDTVHQEAIRIDYSPTVVAGTEYELPLLSITLNEVVPGDESNITVYSVRHALFSSTYGNYQLRK